MQKYGYDAQTIIKNTIPTFLTSICCSIIFTIFWMLSYDADTIAKWVDLTMISIPGIPLAIPLIKTLKHWVWMSFFSEMIIAGTRGAFELEDKD